LCCRSVTSNSAIEFAENNRPGFNQPGLQSKGKSMNAESIVMLIVSAGLMVYLLYALLRPEKF
jgi:K+-transporting ATPase KdpF subunit